MRGVARVGVNRRTRRDWLQGVLADDRAQFVEVGDGLPLQLGGAAAFSSSLCGGLGIGDASDLSHTLVRIYSQPHQCWRFHYEIASTGRLRHLRVDIPTMGMSGVVLLRPDLMSSDVLRVAASWREWVER
jgi:hypothetical protein